VTYILELFFANEQPLCIYDQHVVLLLTESAALNESVKWVGQLPPSTDGLSFILKSLIIIIKFKLFLKHESKQYLSSCNCTNLPVQCKYVILFDWWAVKSAESWLTSSGFSTCSAWCHTPSRDLFPIIPKINYSHWLVFLKTCLNKSYFHFDNTQKRWCLPVGYISCCSNSLLYIVVVFLLG